MHMEPWDGPAGIVLTDGRYAACVMDRNGLCPARYVITGDRHITLASEIGVYDYQPEDVLVKGRLRPGQMVAVDTANGQMLYPSQIDDQLRDRQPYRQWLKVNSRRIVSLLQDKELCGDCPDSKALARYEKMFNVTFEERDQIIRVLAEQGQEAVGSMGDDAPLPVLSKQVRSLYEYFRQQFAQVTNPPIDPLRESIVMSLETCLGRERNLFSELPEHAARVAIASPVLSEGKFQRLLRLYDPDYEHVLIDLNYPQTVDLEIAIRDICERAVQAVRNGAVLIVLSDKDISPGTLPVHALLATGAVHQRLIAEGLRCEANIVVQTGTARDPHHFAVLLGHGATAIYPYLAYYSLNGMVRRGEVKEKGSPSLAQAYRNGIKKGLYKIISKMGICTIASYRGAQLFEIIGLDDDVTDLCFKGSVSRIGGASFADLHHDQQILAGSAWNPRKTTLQGGLLKYVHGHEYHAFNPDVVQSLHKAVRSGDYRDYQAFADLVNHRPVTVLRDLFKLREDVASVPIETVEPIEAILARFDSAAMSLGAISPEAHETLAEAMNRLGGHSNSGEGGEDPRRYGTVKTSKIKQVASGRFGVTPHYLRNAQVIQIKIAQGAKPGEGGQLPGHKVNKMIATLRYSSPGVALISPPPHHDIYSIEDLAQLIFDLKQVNPEALVSVKLVAEAGVGTIAAGVAKAYADLITIAGYDGGTGASPLTSVKYAGIPWELGLAETHLTLRANNLREKVRLQVDGGLKTGLDIIKAAILGAESFGFGTAPIIAMGCKYLRICHLNNCATGVATQDNVLRMHYFRGQVDMVVNYFQFVAQETRKWLARLGVCKLNELIGRTDLLNIVSGDTTKQQRLKLTAILHDGGLSPAKPQFCQVAHNLPFDKGELAERMVADMLPAIEAKMGGEFAYEIKNVNRSIGARVSGEIARRYGNYGLLESPVIVRFRGTAGQSFGAWNVGGLHMHLEGDANDYVGKGMAAGKLVIYPPRESAFKSQESVILGNTCLYGATGGKLFAAGHAGERFGVRNSGAIAVVEGIGDHGCEYMTGGVVVVLGPTGVNFGAGMTGGFSMILDLDNRFVDRCNLELVDIQRMDTKFMDAHQGYLRELLDEYVAETRSEWGTRIIEDFFRYLYRFWLIKPRAAELNSLIAKLRQAA